SAPGLAARRDRRRPDRWRQPRPRTPGPQRAPERPTRARIERYAFWSSGRASIQFRKCMVQRPKSKVQGQKQINAKTSTLDFGCWTLEFSGRTLDRKTKNRPNNRRAGLLFSWGLSRRQGGNRREVLLRVHP